MPARHATVLLVLTGLNAGLALGGCTAPPPQQAPVGTVTVGLLAAADDEGPGAEAVRGAALAVEVVNAAHPDLPVPLAAGTGLPGLGGAPLALAVAETGSQPPTETELGELRAHTSLAGVVVADRADVVEAVGAYASRQRIPLVDSAATASYLLDIGFDWYFRTGPTDRMLVDAVLAALPTDAGPNTRLTVLAPGDGHGVDLASLVREQATAAGLAVTDEVSAGEGAAEALAVAAPDVVVAVALNQADRPALFASLQDWTASPAGAAAGTSPGRLSVALGQDLAADPAAPVAGVEPPPGLLYASAWSNQLAQRQPAASAVAAHYLDRYQEPMSEAGARAFAATMALVTAIDAAGAIDPAAVRAALRQLSIPATQTIMPWHGIRFGETGQNELAAAVVEQVGSGAATLVYPPELADADARWQPLPQEPVLGVGTTA